MENSDFKRTYIYGESALGNLKKNQMPAYPRNYEIWYTYAAGFNRGLNKAINDVLRTNGTITLAQLDTIYEEILSPNRLSDRVDEVGVKISSELRTIVNEVEQYVSSTSNYGNSLLGASQDLSKTEDRQVIREIVSQLISETREAEEKNRSLNDQLAASQAQVMELRESLDTIRYESLTDDLTTLANRKHFDRTLEHAMQDANETGEPLTLLITDIDHFKQFNDTFGHQTGDQVLRLVAVAVKQNVKGQDIPCRYGGEEFAVILPRTNLRQAVAVAENIRKAVMAKELIKRSTGENLGRITISIGCSVFTPGDHAQDLIERADQCMYTAKRQGRNLVKCETDPDVPELLTETGAA
ncbi:GGDEF domain-containing protein [Cohaesibacter celericrescens]|jgi:diguanylate cyclase|uniref:diguanylate cyclase n=1 Tax=Cohaesibacter celericrescens TaxID=2067669 RepID=A0A2N5XSE9_9HYPH|nr:GGDEF domain-containing protein [Cohaesibacter celericrescens]PLW77446.1 GGDEF domain-containing protein [Cohaesibacter celericrescens]